MIMARVLGQISIEISMHPGAVSTCLADELMNKQQKYGAEKPEKRSMTRISVYAYIYTYIHTYVSIVYILFIYTI